MTSQQIEVESSNGVLSINALTGVVDKQNSQYYPSDTNDKDFKLQLIHRFDVEEWEKYYGLSLASEPSVDILELGYWYTDIETGNEKYEPPIDECRGAYKL